MLNGNKKRWMSSGIAALLSIAMLAGCGGNSGTNEGASGTTPGSDKPGAEVELYENGLPKNEEVTLKVGLFVGGYGRDFFDNAAESFKAKYPNVKLDITASADMKTILSTRISAGNDKDMFDLFNTEPSGGIVGLAEAGKLEPMDDIWEYPLPDAPDKKVKDLMMPGMYESTPLIQGKRYEFTTASSFGGLFFNKKLFEEHGWNQNPNTWDEFKTLLADIKADGIAPITFPGIHPSYHNWAFGVAKNFELADINGHVDEFIENYRTYGLPQYTNPENIEAWTRFYELGKEGYFAEGLPALNHTQSQMQVIQGQAAMVSTGTHVENEMKEATPEDFEWGYMAVPFRENTDQTLWIRSGTTNFNYIWAAKPDLNKKWAKELIAWMVTLENQQFAAENAGALPMRKDLAEDPERAAKLTSSAQAVLKYIADNKAQTYKASRSISISDPNLAQAEKLMNENIVKFAMGLQDPKPILEQAEELLKKAVEAEKK
ncbi:ABC transporter substrate-binding protein [Paenibacillus lemnae]|uniref:Extracellular solute-binding protein n=1 Tax=Paenibacillus lemnae TaxID=1330551 RepID=A0A848M049_PAELE|nr:extracellular solute-binding protein [Paenibacillus lemnae]NMO94268.1 extracellular solute-binding protein [Paenibacillus lemnae]